MINEVKVSNSIKYLPRAVAINIQERAAFWAIILGVITVTYSVITFLNVFLPDKSYENSYDNGISKVFNVSSIVEKNLFGNAPENSSISSEFSNAISQFLLKGIFLSDSNEKAGAVIVFQGEEKIYKVGEALPDNSVLAEVYSDKVIIKKGQETGTLLLMRNS